MDIAKGPIIQPVRYTPIRARFNLEKMFITKMIPTLK